MTTPENMTKLKPNEVFIFGSNSAGQHIGGAARLAHENFGAEWGVGEGLTGQSYAFPTLTEKLQKRTPESLGSSVEKLRQTALANPDKTFYLTKVGCGIAGFGEEYMALYFKDMPDNVIKPEGW